MTYNELPMEIDIPLEDDDIFNSICEYVSDYISEQTGFCHKGFEINIQIKALKIQWDISQ